MKPLSDRHRRILLVELHRLIHSYASGLAADLSRGTVRQPTYPPDVRIDEAERAVLERVTLDEVGRSAMSKVIANAIAGTVFETFSVMDMVAEPAAFPGEEQWPGAVLAEWDDEHHEFLHDEFYETYWDYEASIEGRDSH